MPNILLRIRLTATTTANSDGESYVMRTCELLKLSRIDKNLSDYVGLTAYGNILNEDD